MKIFRAVKRDDYFVKRTIAYGVGVFVASIAYAFIVEEGLMQLGVGEYARSTNNYGYYAVLRVFNDGFFIFLGGIIPAILHTEYYGRIRTLKDVAWLTLAAVVIAFLLGHLAFLFLLDDASLMPLFRNSLAFGWVFGGLIFGYLRVMFFDHWHYD